MKQSINH